MNTIYTYRPSIKDPGGENAEWQEQKTHLRIDATCIIVLLEKVIMWSPSFS
jgi:hypothetical protein